MSTVNLSDLMRELQAGEEARMQVPALTSQISDLTRRLDQSQRHSQELETSIIDYKRTIDGLNAKVRSLEVERDDAGFRELEAQERIATMLNALRGFRHDIDETVDRVDPPKPAEPAPQPVSDAGVSAPVNPAPQNIPITDHGDQSASSPTPTSTPIPSGQDQPVASAPAMDTSSSAPATGTPANPPANATTPEGESASHPTAQSTEPTPAHASGEGAGPSDAADSSNNPQAYRPFEGQASGVGAAIKDGAGPRKTEDYEPGKRWYQKPECMSTADWVAAGGQP
jgi:hypothetical protein